MTCDSVFNLQKKSIRKMAYNERISEDLAQSNRKENDIGKYIFFSDLKEITSIKNVLLLYLAYDFQFVVVTPSQVHIIDYLRFLSVHKNCLHSAC